MENLLGALVLSLLGDDCGVTLRRAWKDQPAVYAVTLSRGDRDYNLGFTERDFEGADPQHVLALVLCRVQVALHGLGLERASA